MKPLKGDQQLRSVSLSYSVALQALEPKPSPRRRKGLDASTDRGLTEMSGEVFLLDILSHEDELYRDATTAILDECRIGDRLVARRRELMSRVIALENQGLQHALFLIIQDVPRLSLQGLSLQRYQRAFYADF
jgi:hypothetical protein